MAVVKFQRTHSISRLLPLILRSCILCSNQASLLISYIILSVKSLYMVMCIHFGIYIHICATITEYSISKSRCGTGWFMCFYRQINMIDSAHWYGPSLTTIHNLLHNEYQIIVKANWFHFFVCFVLCQSMWITSLRDCLQYGFMWIGLHLKFRVLWKVSFHVSL